MSWPRCRLVVSSFVLTLACSEDVGPSLAKAGELCEATPDCDGELRCDRGVCVDDEGPSVAFGIPQSLEEIVTGSSEVLVWMNVWDYVTGDQVQIEFDYGESSSSSALLTMLDAGRRGRTAYVEIASAVTSGPHHLRARVLDADGVAYPNPSATTHRLVFAPDPMIPSTPQVGFVWPPPDHEHRIDRDLEIEVATLPGSFAFSSHGYGSCPPLPDCEPAFAPECEDDCGPVDRFGHAKIFALDGYPGCLLDEPIGCNGEYLMSLRPGEVELVDAFVVRATLPADRLAYLGPGEHVLHVALSYDNHDPYPSAAGVIYDSVRITLIEP